MPSTTFLRRAEELVVQGADLLDVGGVKAGPGPEVTEAEELDRVIPSIEALHARFDVAISCDTWRAGVLDAACAAGAVVGNDISGFGDPEYLTVAAAAPGVGRGHPHPARASGPRSRAGLRRPGRRRRRVPGRASRLGPRPPGSRPSRSASTPVSTSGKTPAMSAVLLRESAVLAGHGFVLLLSASNKRYIGDLLGLEIDDRREASLASVAYGVMQGCRVVRVHDVAGSVKVCRMVEAILARRAEADAAG